MLLLKIKTLGNNNKSNINNQLTFLRNNVIILLEKGNDKDE